MFNSHLKLFIISLSTFTLLQGNPAHSQQYDLPNTGSRLIGDHLQHEVKEGEYLHAISQQYNIGLMALMASNPGVDPFLPAPGTILELPTTMLIPDTVYKGIVINLPELRLYYFPKNSRSVHVFPVGIGREGRKTPLMKSFVKTKLKNPIWTPTANTRDEYLKTHKTELPAYIGPGEQNPLGDYALQLGYGSSNYLIHGTNQNFGIGMRISAGCIRMNPADIEWLYQTITVNEPVTIINHPIKFAIEPDGDTILEVHSPLSMKMLDDGGDMERFSERFENMDNIDKKAVKRALLLHYGIPVNVDI